MQFYVLRYYPPILINPLPPALPRSASGTLGSSRHIAGRMSSYVDTAAPCRSRVIAAGVVAAAQHGAMGGFIRLVAALYSSWVSQLSLRRRLRLLELRTPDLNGAATP